MVSTFLPTFHFHHSAGSRPRILKGYRTDTGVDEQIAQMYELMQAIRKQELEDNDPEFQAAIGKGEGEKQ